jgi:nuclear inhibitor of protein phosphatase 1
MVSHSRAGKPPTGLHLDVIKESKLIQKLMVDEKRCYLFGRNAQMCDFCVDHSRCLSYQNLQMLVHRYL